jgi:hypothetical protein
LNNKKTPDRDAGAFAGATGGSPVAMPTRVCSEFSTRVNKPENDDPSIVEPIAIATSAA